MKTEKSKKIVSFQDIAELYNFKPVNNKVGSNEKRKKCPNDDVFLLKIKIDNTILDYCPECFGIWFDKDELDQILSKNIKRKELLIEEEINKVFDQLHKDCPNCRRKLFKKNIKSVLNIDYCKNCKGIWLDGGEFAILYHSRNMDKIDNVLFTIINDCNVDIYI